MMKKVLFCAIALFCSVASHAQFLIYQPAGTPQQQYQSPSPGYGVPYTIYQPAPMPGQRQQAAPRMQEVTLTGYYKDNRGWHSAPIRVGVTGEKVVVLSVKNGNHWMNCGNAASMVGQFDTEEVKDSFTYKAFCYAFGTIYF